MLDPVSCKAFKVFRLGYVLINVLSIYTVPAMLLKNYKIKKIVKMNIIYMLKNVDRNGYKITRRLK